MKEQSVSGPTLAEQSGVKPSFIYDVLSGKSANPSSIKLARVAEALGVSISYLVGESGAFAETATAMDTRATPHRLTSATAPYLWVPRLEMHTKALVKSSVRKLPAQEPYRFNRTWILTQLHAIPDDLRLFTVRDDAMAPTLRRGDAILVNLSKKRPSPPGIFVLFDGFSLVSRRLKRISKKQPPTVRILCDSPHHTTVERSLEKIRILGRVVWVGRKV